MPQITLEYTGNITEKIDFDDLFEKVHSVLQHTGKINIENCKSRAIKLENFYVAQGDSSNAFVHLSVRFLEGRSDEIKQTIGEQLMYILKQFYSASIIELKTQLTVEIQDIKRQEYFKFPEGSFTPVK